MKSGIKKSLIAVSISGMIAAPSAFATNGYFAHGYSTKEKGLAGAGVAYSKDALSIANNPAGIAGMGERLDVGAALFNPNRSYTTTGGPSDQCTPQGCSFSIGPQSIDSGRDLFLIPHIAYNWKLDADTSFALGAYGNGGMNTSYKGGTASLPVSPTAPPTHATVPGTFGGSATGASSTTGVDLAQLFINASYAVKVNEDHAFGASLIFAYQTFKADGLGAFSAQSSDPAHLTNNGDDASSGLGAKLGWQGAVSSDVTIGLSYQSKISMSEFDDYAGLFAEGGDFDIPATASLGLAWSTSDRSTLVFDVQSIFYSDIASIANPIANINPPSCVPTPPAGPGTGNGCLGGSNGAGFGWEDMTVVKIGYEWLSGDMTYRVGLSNGSQPIPESETMFNILAPAVMETHVTFGLTMPVSTDSEFSFAAMYAPSNSVSGVSPFDGAQTIEIEMDQFEVQGTYTMKF